MIVEGVDGGGVSNLAAWSRNHGFFLMDPMEMGRD